MYERWKGLLMGKIALSIFVFIFCLCPQIALSINYTQKPVRWESPLPRILDSGVDLKEVEKLIGEDGQFILRRDPREVTCLSKGKLETYPGGVVVSAMKIVNEPVEKVRNIIKDFSLISDIQSQHTHVQAVSHEDNHALYSYTQEYKMGIITLKSDFLIQQTFEKDGSISTMLHEGDVDAQIQRWEFIPLDEGRTMLVLTFWSAYSTARLSFKILMAVMAESHLIAPVMFCSMYLEQYTDYINKDKCLDGIDPKIIKEKPVLPIYTRELSEKGRFLIESLVVKGTVFLRTYQYANVGNKISRIPVLTTFDNLDIPVEKASPIIADIYNRPDAIPILKSMKQKKIPAGPCIREKYKIGKFPLLIPMFTQQAYSEVKDNFFTFENRGGEGAYYPYSGAYEWGRIAPQHTGGKSSTLYIYTHSLKVGPDANLYIRTLDRLMPDSENVQLVFSAIIFVETRIKWIEKNYNMRVENNA